MKYYKLIAILFVGMFVVVGIAGAQTTTGTSTQAKQKQELRRLEVKEKMQELRQGNASSTPKGSSFRCDALQGRIQKRIDHFDANYQKHYKVYEAHKRNLMTLSAKLEAKGIDVTDLKDDVAELDTKIEDLEDKVAEVQDDLRDLLDISCGEDNVAFRESVKTVREGQKQIATQVREIFVFLRSTLKKDLMDIRSEYKTEQE